jgi:hypothetical protein
VAGSCGIIDWTESEKKWPWPNFSSHLGICRKEVGKGTKILGKMADVSAEISPGHFAPKRHNSCSLQRSITKLRGMLLLVINEEVNHGDCLATSGKILLMY